MEHMGGRLVWFRILMFGIHPESGRYAILDRRCAAKCLRWGWRSRKAAKSRCWTCMETIMLQDWFEKTPLVCFNVLESFSIIPKVILGVKVLEIECYRFPTKQNFVPQDHLIDGLVENLTDLQEANWTCELSSLRCFLWRTPPSNTGIAASRSSWRWDWNLKSIHTNFYA